MKNVIIILLLFILITIQIITAFVYRSNPSTDIGQLINILFTIISVCATLTGLAFAIYGWFRVHKAEALQKEAKDLVNKFHSEKQSMQEALQKMTAAYSLTDNIKKIELLKEVIKLDPNMYNVYETLGYTYIEMSDLESAKESFLIAYHKSNNTNYQACCDLAYLYIKTNNTIKALEWMKQAINIDDKCIEYFNSDKRAEVAAFIKHNKEKFDTISKM